MASLSLTTVSRAATDEALLERFALANDREAITELAWRHEAAMLGLAWSLLRERTAAEDAVQDTWVRVIRHAKSFRGQSAFRTWLLRILIHRCRDAVRASITSRARTASYAATKDEAAPLDRPDLDEDARRIAKAVAKLSPARAELVILCHHHGLTHAQAAEVLQIPVGTVKTRLYAAIDELRAILGEEGSSHD